MQSIVIFVTSNKNDINIDSLQNQKEIAKISWVHKEGGSFRKINTQRVYRMQKGQRKTARQLPD